MNILKKVIQFYRLLNLLSVDVAIGAMCSSVFFAHIFQADITYFSILSLGLSVWIIYTADHLLDAKKMKASATTDRHRLHQQHFRLLLIMMIIVAGINAVVLFYIRKPALITGVVLIVLVILYLLIQHSLKFLKELFVAVVYTAGVLIPATSNTEMIWRDWPWMVIVQFALVALLNLVIFSWFDYENDLKDNRVSFVTIFGRKVSQIFIVFLFVLSAILIVVTLSFGIETTILFVMNGTLLFMFLFHSYFAHHDRYRLLGDAAFFIPVFVLFF
ncbi:MAG TPA: hypothetical protein PLJ60_06680 [Chryseolinea sp.]|nr:hypothetical protein [Chryseolinea sp.]HPH46890.1 hypothetical protein [Chryseolinea sp.]HPM30003.1 hypothetical protein [Chryseolinea sp.]